jgi:hypothetical protein
MNIDHNNCNMDTKAKDIEGSPAPKMEGKTLDLDLGKNKAFSF